MTDRARVYRRLVRLGHRYADVLTDHYTHNPSKSVRRKANEIVRQIRQAQTITGDDSPIEMRYSHPMTGRAVEFYEDDFWFDAAHRGDHSCDVCND